MMSDVNLGAEQQSTRAVVRILIQVLGFAASIAALGWAVKVALKEENRAQLENLQDASVAQVMMLVGLSFASVAVNGVIFWVVIRPVHKIRVTDVISMCAIVFRLLDVLAFAGRFVVAASVLGLPISGNDALLLGSVYFLIGVFSPFGMLGTREAGTIGAAALFGVSSAAIGTGGGDGGEGPIAAAVVFITAVEAVVNLGCAGFGVAWLRIAPKKDAQVEHAD